MKTELFGFQKFEKTCFHKTRFASFMKTELFGFQKAAKQKKKNMNF